MSRHTQSIMRLKDKISRKSFVTAGAGLAFAVLFSLTALTFHWVNLGSHASPTCTPNAALVNPCRPWLGAAAAGNPKASTDAVAQFTYLESQVGHGLDIFHDYHKPGSLPMSSAEIHFAKRANTYVYANWKPASNWAEAGGGNASVNANIDKAAASIKSIAPHKIFLTIWHEPQNDVSGGTACATKSGASAGTPAQYRAMWANVENRFKKDGVNNVVWVMNYSGYSKWDCLVPALWPGNSLVNWVTYDTYPSPTSPTWADTVGRMYHVLQKDNSVSTDFAAKPWGVAEFGTCSLTSETQADQYFQGAKSAVDARTYPNLKMYMIYASTGNNAGPGCLTNYTKAGAIDSTKQSYFKKFADDAAFVTPKQPQRPPTVSITAPANGDTVAGTIQIDVNAASTVGIKKVNVLVNGQVKRTLTASPYDYSWNTKSVPNGIYTLQAKVYDANGNAGTSAAISIKVANPTPPAPRPSGTVGWIISPTAISRLAGAGATKALINTAFNTSSSYITGANNGGVPTASYDSYQAIVNAFSSGTLPGKYKAVLYDNEHWQYTPANEQKDPNHYEQLVGQLLHSHHMLYVATPARDIVLGSGKLNGSVTDTYLSRNIAGGAAKYADVIDIQAQALEADVPSFTSFVKTAAGQARAANSDVKVYVGLSTNPSGKHITNQQMLNAYNAVRSQASGYWLNVPQGGSHCPSCGQAQPQVGVYLLDKIYGTQPSKPSVEITSPANGGTVSGVVPFNVSVGGMANVSSVQLLVNGVVVDTMTNSPYNFDWDTSHLTAGSYTLQAGATGGGTTIKSPAITVKVAPNAPQPPTGLVSPTQTATTINLTWKPAAGGDSAVAHYLVYRNNLVVGEPTGTNFVDNGLTPNTKYAYAVAAVNRAGLTSNLSASMSTRTKTVVDHRAPSTPTNLHAQAPTGNQVNLTWNASTDNVAVAGYKIKRDGKQIATAQTTSFGDATVKSGTKYSYQIAAYDAAGNTSNYTATVTVTTPGSQKPKPLHGATILYYAKSNFSGNSYVSISPNVAGNYGTNSPLPGKLPTHGYGVRWRGRVAVSKPGTYTFYLQATGGRASLELNNQTVIDGSQTIGGEASVAVKLAAGQYNFRVQYANTGGPASVGLLWSGPNALIQKVLVPSSALYPQRFGLRTRYYDNTGFAGAPKLYELAPTVDFNWGTRSPAAGVPATGFSAQWDGYVVAPKTGNYTFYTQTDDGASLWLNGQQLVNDWHDHRIKQDSDTMHLQADKAYPILMQFYQNEGRSAARLLWSTSGIKQEIIPSADLYENLPVPVQVAPGAPML